MTDIISKGECTVGPGDCGSYIYLTTSTFSENIKLIPKFGGFKMLLFQTLGYCSTIPGEQRVGEKEEDAATYILQESLLKDDSGKMAKEKWSEYFRVEQIVKELFIPNH